MKYFFKNCNICIFFLSIKLPELDPNLVVKIPRVQQ
jgi:hypothetical protein